MDLSLQNVKKHIDEEFTELHSLTPSPSELINVTTFFVVVVIIAQDSKCSMYFRELAQLGSY